VTRALYGLGRLCARRRWVVLGAWFVLLVGLATASGIAGSALNNDLSLPGTDSQAASDLLTQRFPAQANGMNPLMLQAPKGHKITDKQYSQAIGDAVNRLKQEPTIHQIVSPLSDSGKSQVSKDGRTAYIAMYLKTSAAQLTEDQAQELLDDGDPAEKAGLSVSAGGYVGQSLSAPATESSEVVGLVMAVIVLVFTFGSFVAMGMPILTAIFGLACGLSLITLLSHLINVPTIAPTLATMIGLGVGIDYALFIVSRYREYLHKGMDMQESIARSIASSGGAVVFAGATVIVALASLAVVGIPLVSTLGFTAALVVLLAVLAAITLLPALLAIAGPRIDKLRLPIKFRTPTPEHPGFWAGWGRFVAHHPIVTGLVALAALLALAIPALTMWLGQEDNGALPQSTQSRQSYDAMTQGFGVGLNGPFLISVDLSKDPAKPDQSNIDKINQQEQQQKQKATDQADQQEAALEAQGVPAAQAQAQVQPQLDQQLDQITQQANEQKQKAKNPASDPRLQTLRTDLQKTPGVKSVSQPLVNNNGKAAVLNLIAKTSPSDQKTSDLVDTLRDDVIPKAIKGEDMKVYVGGSTAGNVDLAEEISNALPRTIAVVIGLSFILLVLAFRSLVIPLTAAVMNVLSIGAAFGVLTAVFEKGFLLDVIGLEHTVPIVSYVPLMMFAVLFGLSMDYEVFLISHMQEAWGRLRDNRAAVIDGVTTTGTVITAAALIMISVFFAFIINGDPVVKQFGVGMGVAILIDATLVRRMLVPALMVLIGKANWWFPHWLRWVPNLSIEGEEWFRQRDELADELARREAEADAAKV
jgi:RND superfamily putative drug exporter